MHLLKFLCVAHFFFTSAHSLPPQTFMRDAFNIKQRLLTKPNLNALALIKLDEVIHRATQTPAALSESQKILLRIKKVAEATVAQPFDAQRHQHLLQLVLKFFRLTQKLTEAQSKFVHMLHNATSATRQEWTSAFEKIKQLKAEINSLDSELLKDAPSWWHQYKWHIGVTLGAAALLGLLYLWPRKLSRKKRQHTAIRRLNPPTERGGTETGNTKDPADKESDPTLPEKPTPESGYGLPPKFYDWFRTLSHSEKMAWLKLKKRNPTLNPFE